MREFEALVLYHYDFEDKNGKEVSGTKYLVSLGKYGTAIANGPFEEKLLPLMEVSVELAYENRKFKVKKVIK